MTKEEKALYNRRYYLAHKDKAIAYGIAYRSTPKGRKMFLESQAKGDAKRLETPEGRAKKHVRAVIDGAVRRGRVEKKPCEACGATVGVQKHHPDYSRPLLVNWLCPVHHRAVHARNGRSNGSRPN